MKQLIAALRSGKQADMDGTTVIVSRQACEEAADALEAQEKDPDDRRDDMPVEIKAWHSTPTLDHIGSWATTRYPEFTVTYVRKDSIAEQVPAVLVKPLEWRVSKIDQSHLSASAFGVEVFYFINGAPGNWTLFSPGGSGYVPTPGYESQAFAKAAAQTDYERRILSAITARKGGGA